MISFSAPLGREGPPRLGLGHDREPFLDPGGSLEGAPHQGQRLVGLDLREEAEPADLHAEHRRAHLRRQVCGAQEGAVATDGYHQIDGGGIPREVDDLDAVRQDGPTQVLGGLDRRVTTLVRDESDARHARTASPSVTTASRSTGSGGAPARRYSEELDVARRSRQR